MGFRYFSLTVSIMSSVVDFPEKPTLRFSGSTGAVFENLKNRLRAVRNREFVAHCFVVQKFRDGGKGAKMGLELVFGNDEKHDEVHWRPVQRFKGDPCGGAPKGGHNLVDLG